MGEHLSVPKDLKLSVEVFRTALVFQWLRIHLPVQGTQVQSLVREDSKCPGAITSCTTAETATREAATVRNLHIATRE